MAAADASSHNAVNNDDVQQEIDAINTLLANYNDEDDASWIAEVNLNSTNNQSEHSFSSCNILDASADGFDGSTGNSWMFPIGYEKRQYQLNISRNTLFNNTLVILPTGLGKTLIASVTIYNFFRWFPKSKIIFMAPTRPLVNQQISACYDVVGISKEVTAEMTGKIPKEKRKALWDSRRVFFATGQVVAADMADGILPTKLVKLLVFDEAHKAKKGYAYCQVINEALKVQNKFRVLALTATAGKSCDVIQIIQNLLISKIDYRSEDSLDVRPYTHQKKIETVCVKLTFELQEIYDKMLQFVDPIIKDLRQGGFAQAYSISKGYLIMEQNKIRESKTLSQSDQKSLMGLVGAAHGMYYSLEILERHSVHLFLKSLRDEKNGRSYKYFISRDKKLYAYIRELEEKFAQYSPYQVDLNLLQNGQAPIVFDKKIDFGHPKFDILKAKLTEYFNSGGGGQAKAIIFCEYRDTTDLIMISLLQLRPLVEARCLIGQGGKITQKEQLSIMKEFRDGKVNTLICTCVAEEGLDIGAVDLVICFDIGSKNPTRFVQRIGRTARKRNGKVIVLATVGRELQMIKELVATKDAMNKSISRNKDISKYFYAAPRLIPKQFNPQCIETKFVIAAENAEVAGVKKKKEAKKGKKVVKAPSSKESITNHFKPASSAREKASTVQDEKTQEIPCNAAEMGAPGTEAIELIVIDCIESEKSETNLEEYSNMYMDRINQFVKDNQLENNKFLRELIEYRSRDGKHSIRRLAKMLESPPKMNLHEDLNFDDIADNLNLSPACKKSIKPIEPKKKNKSECAKASSPLVSVQFASPDFAQFKQQQQKLYLNASTPLVGRNLNFDNFLSQVDLAPSLAVKEASSVAQEQPSAANDKFPFLGVNSVSDIFEGCVSKLFVDMPSAKSLAGAAISQRASSIALPAENEILGNELLGCSINKNQKTIVSVDDNINQGDVETHDAKEKSEHDDQNQNNSDSDVSITELANSYISLTDDVPEMENKEVYDKFNIDDINDLFGEGFLENSQSGKSDSGESDKTRAYDFEEEMMRTEGEEKVRDEIEKNDSGKSKENQEFPQRRDIAPPSRPNFSKLLAAFKTNSLDSLSAARSVLQQQNCNSEPISPLTPIRKGPIKPLQCDSTPETSVQLNKTSSKSNAPSSEDENDCLTQTPIAKRKKNVKTFKARNSFLYTQADADEEEEEEGDVDDGHESDTLDGFVVNETVHVLDRTRMQLKYLESLQSPNAPVNRRNVRSLKPVNLSQVFSQSLVEEECEDDDEFASFIVKTDEEASESEHEIDELEMAERLLREKRRRKRMNLSDSSGATASVAVQRNKKRKVVKISDSSSEDEGMKQLRREVEM